VYGAKKMCGITGCVLNEGNAAPLLVDSIRRLEYRGYDSVGIATIHEGRLIVKKDKGRLSEVQEALELSETPGKIGIGHTRWATHGAPSKENAHPHVDCECRVALAHNGIIENFVELKRQLEKSGHTFRSGTDSEIICHLLEEDLSAGSLQKAASEVSKKLKGSFALAILSVDEPDTIVCVRRESPLVIGVSQTGTFCASDIPAFLPLTNRVVYLEENEVATLTWNSVKIHNIETGEELERSPVRIDWGPEAAQKSGYPHFTLKEINEQPRTIRDSLRTNPLYLDLMSSLLDRAERTFLVSCGTSYNACVYGSYALAKLAGLPAQAVVASEFVEHFDHVIDEDTVVLAVSQSGETADTLGAVRAAREMGAKILSITNVMGSTLTRLSDAYIGQNSGPEIGVAATKTFTSQVAVLARLSLVLAKKRGCRNIDELEKIEDQLKRTPSIVESFLSQRVGDVRALAFRYSSKEGFCFLGRGISLATVLEGRLKLLELSYIHSLAFPAGESKHGFISIVEPGYPVIFVAPRDETHSRILGNIMEMKARGAEVIAIIEDSDEEVATLADAHIKMPRGLHPILTPLVYIIPLQLFAYYIAVNRGYDPDHPRNLAKSVTVQ
jgi:glucosamine--fructose-6-phosphate aminotransferase (isomerizing)